MTFLDKLKKEHQKSAPALLIYAEHGVGKTTLATQFPDSCVVHHADEDGVGDLKSAGLIDEGYPSFEVSTWDELCGLTRELKEKKPFKLVTYDTANTCCQRLCLEHVCKQNFQSDWSEFKNFEKGASRSEPEWTAFLHQLTELRRSGVMVILLAHATKATFTNPEGQNWIRYQPDLYYSESKFNRVDLLGLTKKWATDIGFMDFKVEAVDKGGKAKGGRARRIRFNHEAAFDAKNRHGLVDPIDLGFTPEDAYKRFVTAFRNKPKSKPE